jgi:hypothetical protein
VLMLVAELVLVVLSMMFQLPLLQLQLLHHPPMSFLLWMNSG